MDKDESYIEQAQRHVKSAGGSEVNLRENTPGVKELWDEIQALAVGVLQRIEQHPSWGVRRDNGGGQRRGWKVFPAQCIVGQALYLTTIPKPDNQVNPEENNEDDNI